MTGRLIALGTLVVAIVAVVVIVMGGGAYTVHARFVDGGQLVKGGLIEVGGRTIGKIGQIKLAPDGTADVAMKITDAEYDPLHRGTIARVRTVGLSGVANRFVEVTPGPDAGAKIPDDGIMTTAETRTIVDLDVLFDSLDAPTRGRLQRIIKNGAQLFDGTAQDANSAFGYLAPALAQSDLLVSELASDRVAVDKLISTGSTTASALASKRDDISQGISSTATTLRAIASERVALADSLARAPALLNRPDGILGGLRQTLQQVRPALREARPVAAPLAAVLRRLVPTARNATPVLARTRQLLPQLDVDLDGLPKLARVAVPALNSTTTALIAAMPVVDGLRPYVPDLIAGFFSGLGRSLGYYDANGNYGRVSVQGGTSTLTGLLGGAGAAGGVSTGNTARCAGGATEPADDKSNPYIENPANCNPAHDLGSGG